MNNKIANPFLKQLISEIAVNANKGRLNLSWEIIEEAKKKKKVREADEKKADAPAADAGEGQPPAGGANETPADTGNAEQAPAPDAAAPDASPEKADAAPEAGAEGGADAGAEAGADAEAGAGEGDVDKAKEDATKAKAELEKAKAEKEQAEKELKDQSYVKLSSSGGTEFLLGKLLDQAFKANTIDALAGEMVDKLKIDTPDDVNNFANDVATYLAMPGMSDLLSSMKGLATNQPEKTEEPAA